MPQLYLNNFQTVFIASVKAAPDSSAPASELDYGVLRVSDGAAGQLVSPGAGDWYILTAYKREGSLESNIEVMRVTSVDNSVVGECRLTVLRGQEGSIRQAYQSGDMLEMRITAGGMREFAQNADPRFTNARTPTGPAGGVLSGSYPNPGFAQAMATAVDLAGKVDKVAGKGLSANDYTNASVAKLAGIAEQATKNATDAQLRDRSTHTGAQAISTVTGLQTAIDGKAPLNGVGTSGTWPIAVSGNAATASAVPFSGITGKPTTLAGYGITDGADLADFTFDNLVGKPNTLKGYGINEVHGPEEVEFFYDGNSRIIEIAASIDGDGKNTQFVYNADGTVKTITTQYLSLTRTVTFLYDGGKLSRTTATEVQA